MADELNAALHAALPTWVEENVSPDYGYEPSPDGNAALLDLLKAEGAEVVLSSQLTELRNVATSGYAWPAPLPYPLHKPQGECEQFYCLTERFPKEAVLQMWGDGENAPEWCEWDGDNWAPTSHTILGFWPMPVPAAGTAEGLRAAATQPAPASEAVLSELEALLAEPFLTAAPWHTAPESTIERPAGIYDNPRGKEGNIGFFDSVTDAVLAAALRNAGPALLARLRAAEAAVPQWIPVGERLPEVGTTVLAVLEHPAGSRQVIAADYPFEGYWADLDGSRITHWQPSLPLPSQEGASHA